MQNTFWDNLTSKYLSSIKADENGDFAYEWQVNSLSILSLCDNSGNALDLGCGDGRFTKELSTRHQNVYGVDYSKQILKSAKMACPGVKFFLHDLEQSFPDFDIKFDLVVCKLFLMYLKNIENVARESFGVLNTIVHGRIATDKNLGVEFVNRTLETYVNTFTKHGFKLESVLETGVPDTFVIKYPSYLPFQNKPYRLNLKFVKQ